MQKRRFLSNLLLIWGCLNFCCGCTKTSPPLEIVIFHWNDFHAQNRPFKATLEEREISVGGAAYLATLLDSLRTVYTNNLILHAGDEFTGSAICAITKGRSQIEILNLIDPDAFCLGNHEFDYGWGNLRELLGAAEFPALCCNVFDSVSNAPIVLPSMVVRMGDIKVGIIGVAPRFLEGSVIKGALQGLRVEDPVPIVSELLDELKEKTDIQIALTHQGMQEDKRLARSCPGLDLIVGGHSHDRTFDPLVESGVPIVQAGAKGRYLGLFQAYVDTAADRIVRYTGSLISVYADSIRPRDDIAELVELQERDIAMELDRVVGELAEPWVRVDDGESNVGNWTADVMAELTGYDIAFINSGGMRKDVPAGPVTVRDLWELHPFSDQLFGFELSGSELSSAIRHQVETMGDLLQIGGLCYRAIKGKGEIIELRVRGEAVDPVQSYRVVTNEYVVGHADRYFGFDLGGKKLVELGWIDRELVQEAFQRQGRVSSRRDGRILLE
jgi:2',3'-cyclic-nucleotide 2'-phosphodiesterase (5'-nucleotidase family)